MNGRSKSPNKSIPSGTTTTAAVPSNTNNNGSPSLNSSPAGSSPYKRIYSRARQQFSFQELAGTDLTLLMEERILVKVFQFLSFHELFVVKRVCSRWKPLCEHKDCYKDLDMQSFIHNSRYLPNAILASYISTLDMEDEELDALRMVCREIPRVILPIDNNNNNSNNNSNSNSNNNSKDNSLNNSINGTSNIKTNGINGFFQDLSSSINSSIGSLSLSASKTSNGSHLRAHSIGDDTTATISSLTSSNSSNGSLSSSYESPSLLSSNSTPTSSRKIDKETQKKEKLRREREKRMEESIKVWNDEIIPNWEKKKSSKKVRELIFQGIPSLVRERAWPLLIGNDLNITPELFSIFGARAERAKQKGESSLGREGTVTLIHLDLPRTFPMLSIFQNEGPYHQKLANVLEAYVCYRPDVGYVQGMSYLAAIFLLILDEYQAFVCLSNFLNNPCYMTFYTMNLSQMEVYMKAMDTLMQIYIPKVHRHLKELGIQPDIFMIDWVLTIFSKALPLDVATHVWDYLFLEKELFIFQVALGVLKMYSKELENGDFDHCMTLLTHLPSDIDDDELFQNIASIIIKPEQFSKLVAAAGNSNSQ